jgi:acyl carrier protein
MALTKDHILSFLRDHLCLDVSGVSEETPLFSSGLIDSFSLVSLIVELEVVGKFRIAPFDVTLDNLDSIDRILRFAASQATADART